MPKDQPFAANVSSSEVVFDGMIWNVKRESFDFANETLTREFVEHPGAVAVVAINDENQVLMIRQYRHPVGEFLWEIPAGLLDVEGESELLAAERELLEETGYRAAEIEPLIDFYATPGGNSEMIRVFVARGLEFVGRPAEQEGEERQLIVEWVDLSSALDSVLKSEIKSPSAAVGIMALALQRKG
jgi:ADP-ribose pyrophosphatase